MCGQILTYSGIAALKNEFLFALWTALVLFFYGGNSAVYPAATVALYGRERAGVNYGMIFLVYGVCAAVALALLTFVLPGAAARHPCPYPPPRHRWSRRRRFSHSRRRHLWGAPS
jgi:hypothetical protein